MKLQIRTAAVAVLFAAAASSSAILAKAEDSTADVAAKPTSYSQNDDRISDPEGEHFSKAKAAIDRENAKPKWYWQN